MTNSDELNLPRIIEAFNRHDVEYVMIGSMAAVIHGVSYFTEDEDVDMLMQAGERNLDRAAMALRELDARKITDMQQPAGTVPATAADLSARVSMFSTDAGRIDLMTQGVVIGTYEDVGPRSIGFEIDGQAVFVADLMTVIADKEARDLPRDRRQLPDLYALADELGLELKADQRRILERDREAYGYDR